MQEEKGKKIAMAIYRSDHTKMPYLITFCQQNLLQNVYLVRYAILIVYG